MNRRRVVLLLGTGAAATVAAASVKDPLSFLERLGRGLASLDDIKYQTIEMEGEQYLRLDGSPVFYEVAKSPRPVQGGEGYVAVRHELIGGIHGREDLDRVIVDMNGRKVLEPSDRPLVPVEEIEQGHPLYSSLAELFSNKENVTDHVATQSL